MDGLRQNNNTGPNLNARLPLPAITGLSNAQLSSRTGMRAFH